MPKRNRDSSAVVSGGNGQLALRLAKGNRYGKDTYKVRVPSKFHYSLRLLTYTTDQAMDWSGSTWNPLPLTPPLAQTEVSNQKGFNTCPEGDLQYYRALQNPLGYTNGVVSMNSQGLFFNWGEKRPSTRDPWLTTYFAFKLDAKGFNICDPETFAENCSKFQYVKQGPSCATFVFPDLPLDKNDAVTREYTIGQPVNNQSVSSYGVPTKEYRGIGPWEMIIIPPRKMKSINIGNLTSHASWDKLIQMGFKPRPCQKVTKIYCSNSGVDVRDAGVIGKQAVQSATRTSNDISVNSSTNDYVTTVFPTVGMYHSGPSLTSLKWKKHQYLDTEETCQWTVIADPNTTQLGGVKDMPYTSYDTMEMYFKQGYDCVPFGSAIVFRVRQFAPPFFKIVDPAQPSIVTLDHICVRQTIPLDIYLDSVTSFKGPVEGRFDIDQPFSNPFVEPIPPS